MEQSLYKNHLATYLTKLQTDINFLTKIDMPQFNILEIDCSKIDADNNTWIEYFSEKNIDKNCSVLYYISLN